MLNFKSPHSLIGRRFIFYTVLFSSCLALLFTLIQVNLEYQREMNKRVMYEQLINESLLDSLSKSIWTYDDAQIYLQLQGIVKIPTIEQVTLSLPENVKFNVGSVVSSKIIEKQIDVVYSPSKNVARELGKLKLYSGMDETYIHLVKFAGLMLLSNATKTALVVLFMLYLVDRLIGQHLYAISRYLSQHVEGRKPTLLTLNRRHYTENDEIDLLVASLNNMQQRIYFEQHRALSEAEKRELLQSQVIQQKEQMLEIERNVGLGEMALTLADELKQPITGVVGYADISKRILTESPFKSQRLTSTIEKLNENAGLALNIIKRTQKVLKSVDPILNTADANEIITRVILLLGCNFSEADILVTHHVTDNSLLIDIDELQFEQVLINLIRNAIDALGNQPKDVRFIEITAFSDGNLAHIRVEDNGGGINNDVSNKLFRPFFTTKEEGMGIGLSISQNLIAGMKGTITARNRLDRGACFTINLPLVTQDCKEVSGMC